MGGKAKIEFFGTAELLKKIEKASGNVEKAIVDSLRKSAEKPKQEMLDYIAKHHLTGATEESFTEEIREENGKVYMRLGFDIKKGGLPAVFLNYGTPRIAPSFFIDNAIDHNIDEIKRTQEEALLQAFRELI